MHPDDFGLHSEGHQGLPPDAGFRPNDREKLHKGRLCNHAQPLFVLFISWGGGGGGGGRLGLDRDWSTRCRGYCQRNKDENADKNVTKQ